MKLLLVEDEQELAVSISTYLEGLGYVCSKAAGFGDAREKIGCYEYDCILLDIMLPDGDGMKLLQLLKQEGKKEPVIIISAKHSLDDKVKGLQIGADDYLAKPFQLPELAARILAVTRRKQFDSSNTMQLDDLQVNLLAKTVSVKDIPVALTKKEFDLLLFFLGNKNRVLSRSILAEHLSGDFADMLDNHDFVYAHVKNLKRKLAEAGAAPYIKTVYGTGYKWEL